MSVRTEIRLAVSALVAVQVVMALGAIALLGRGAEGGTALAGAWSMVLLALIGLGTSAIVFKRLTARIVAPVAKLDEALAAFGRGDSFRRVRLDAAPPDLARIAAAACGLMDPRGADEEDPRAIAAADRAALLHLLDGMAAPALVVDRRGVPTAVSAAALARLAADSGGALRRALAAAATGQITGGVASVAPVGGGAAFLCTLS
jgi:hypothetical protein